MSKFFSNSKLLEFDEFDRIQRQSMDVPWLAVDGWTVGGNLAYRRILYEFRTKGILLPERVEEIFLHYELESRQVDRVKRAFKEVVDLKKLLSR
jgi:hypothetical protein